MHALSCQAVFEASWERLITPLDTCASVVLEGAHFERVRKHANNLGAIAVANHDHWAHAVREWPMMRHLDPTRQSSILYDTAAVCLAFDESYFEIETLPVRVTDDGATLIDPEHKHLSRCATGWHSHDAFLDFLTDRLTHS